MKNTFLRRMLPLMMAVLCLIPAIALAKPAITGTEGVDYTWDEANNLLTVMGDVDVETSEDNAAFDINVQSGFLYVRGHVIGDVTVKDGNLMISSYYEKIANNPALTGGLSVEGGEVYICGYNSHGEGTATAGVCLTKNSAITGGIVQIEGGNDPEGGKPAMTRENDATLTVSGDAFLDLRGGVMLVSTSPRPDEKSAPALASEDLEMLKWSAPMQMRAGQYKGSTEEFDEWAIVMNLNDMLNKSVIQSVSQSAAGWKITFDANGGTIDGQQNEDIVLAQDKKTGELIVADGYVLQINLSLFTAPEGHEPLNWKVEMDGTEVANPNGMAVTGDVKVTAVWKVKQYTLKFVDEDGEMMDSITADYGTPITMAPSIPDKEGYTFAGWDGEIPKTMPSKDVTLTAKWTKLETQYRVSKENIENANHTYLPYKTTDELKDALRKVLADAGFVGEGELFYDVILEKSEDGGETWDEVHPDDFPEEGYRVVFSYPEGTNKNAFIFKVVHMFSETNTRLNITAGGTETPEVKLTDEGVEMTLKGFSPVLLQWQEKASAAGLPQTGDPSSLLGWAALLCASGLGAGAIRRRKK